PHLAGPHHTVLRPRAHAHCHYLRAAKPESISHTRERRASDRLGAIVLIPFGVAAGGIGMALVGVASSYGLVVLCVILSGLGTAAFHPEGSKFAAYVSGRKRASGMSLFSIGGNLGFGLGALAAALL